MPFFNRSLISANKISSLEREGAASSTTGFLFILLMPLIMRNRINAKIKNAMIALMKDPIIMGPKVILEKSGVPKVIPIMGEMTLSTSDLTNAEIAPPRIIPMAMSNTLPVKAKALNSLIKLFMSALLMRLILVCR